VKKLPLFCSQLFLEEDDLLRQAARAKRKETLTPCDWFLLQELGRPRAFGAHGYADGDGGDATPFLPRR
jgi:hypothetical protein